MWTTVKTDFYVALSRLTLSLLLIFHSLPLIIMIYYYFTNYRCGPCRLSNPVVKEVMKQYSGDIDVVEICTDDLAEVAADAGVISIPTIQFYHGGKLLDTIVGCVAKSVLANAVDKILDDIKPTASA